MTRERGVATADPSADTVHEADDHYLSAFADTIDQLESEGYDIRALHKLMMAQLYLQEGKFREGARLLRRAKRPKLVRMPSLLYSVLRGMRVKLPAGG